MLTIKAKLTQISWIISARLSAAIEIPQISSLLAYIGLLRLDTSNFFF